jgi:uncharacterized membrane protein
VVFAVAAFGLSLLAFVPGGRAEILLALSLGLGAVALREARRAGVGLAVVAGLAFVLPFVCWMSVHGRDLTFGIGAAWLLAATVLFVATAATSTKAVPMPLEAAALVVSGFLTIALSGVPKTPLPLLGLLLAQGAIAVLAVKRFAGAELTSLVAAGLAILANFDRLQKAGGANAVYLVALPVFAFYLLVPVVRRAVGPRVDSDIVGSLTQLANAVFLWSVLYRILYDAHPGLLGFVSVALAVLYLLLGLVIARVQPSDVIGVRTLLGLAASFLTLAIPVQLGLHGITLAWALEGLVLLGLGVRFSSVLTRFGGYGVLALAVGRLFVRHLPLHPDAFVPVMNPSFGIWIAVILCLGAALVVTRAPRREGQALDWVAGRALSVVGLALLFGVLTGESTAAFGQVERLAREAGDAEAAQRARLMGGLSLSVLWSLFATGLLVGGLALRSRALFYTAYALFAVTAAKIVLVDLATLKTVYRILSFLAMGVLLMAGAYLAIRFRARLSTEAPAP